MFTIYLTVYGQSYDFVARFFGFLGLGGILFAILVMLGIAMYLFIRYDNSGEQNGDGQAHYSQRTQSPEVTSEEARSAISVAFDGHGLESWKTKALAEQIWSSDEASAKSAADQIGDILEEAGEWSSELEDLIRRI